MNDEDEIFTAKDALEFAQLALEFMQNALDDHGVYLDSSFLVDAARDAKASIERHAAARRPA